MDQFAEDRTCCYSVFNIHTYPSELNQGTESALKIVSALMCKYTLCSLPLQLIKQPQINTHAARNE